MGHHQTKADINTAFLLIWRKEILLFSIETFICKTGSAPAGDEEEVRLRNHSSFILLFFLFFLRNQILFISYTRAIVRASHMMG